MRKIIGDKLYDTEKATLVYEYPDYELLYVTGKGNFFRIEVEPGPPARWFHVSREEGVHVAAHHRGIDWVLEHLGDYIEEA